MIFWKVIEDTKRVKRGNRSSFRLTAIGYIHSSLCHIHCMHWARSSLSLSYLLYIYIYIYYSVTYMVVFFPLRFERARAFPFVVACWEIFANGGDAEDKNVKKIVYSKSRCKFQRGFCLSSLFFYLFWKRDVRSFVSYVIWGENWGLMHPWIYIWHLSVIIIVKGLIGII